MKIENDKKFSNNILNDKTEINDGKDSKMRIIDQGQGQELMVLTIKLKDKTIQVTIRENANIMHLCELISLFGDFKSYPKKFKEIFHNYVKTEYNNVLTNNKLIIIPTN